MQNMKMSEHKKRPYKGVNLMPINKRIIENIDKSPKRE
jgi:hypothetical protein